MDNAFRADRRVDRAAPVGSVDLAAFEEDGEPYQIYPCDHCLPWHAEIMLDDDLRIFVREWHAVGCAVFRDLIGNE